MATKYNARIWMRLIVVLPLALAAGCATSLPNARALFRNIHREQEQYGKPEVSPDTRLAIESLRKQGYLTAAMARHLSLIRAIAGAPLVGGNNVVLLQNGQATYAAMHRAIAGAKDSVNVETYTFADDKVGRAFASWLIERSRAGVRVNVIYDSVGSLDTPESFFDRMRRSGISVVAFNPLSNVASSDHSITHRDHRKLLVVDGRVAITGSVNIADEYANRHRPEFSGDPVSTSRMFWRNTDVEIEGPAVAQCQQLFVDTWFRETGKLLRSANYFPHPEDRGDELVQVIGSTPEAGFSAMYYTLMSAIYNSRANVYVADAYFAPDRQFLDRLEAAGRRGVDVQLVLPHRTDHPIVLSAARSHYGALLRAHVAIYERLHAVMHCKTATVDGIWSTVGSSNLDWWSIARNDEINVVVLSPEFAAQMEAAFTNDREQSEAITPRAWRKRSIAERFDEFCAFLVQPWL